MPAEDAGRETALLIEREHPKWSVQYGVWSKQFIAFARFATPHPLRLISRDASDLVRQMREAEQYFGRNAGG